MKAGYRCPRCGSYETYYIPFTFNDIECQGCGNEFTPEDLDED